MQCSRGCFIVKEVEHVKTFFRLLPIIICRGGCNAELFISWYKLSDSEAFFEDSNPAKSYSYVTQLIMFALDTPIYHFLLYPLFYNYIPTMLNRVRAGFVLVIFHIVCVQLINGWGFVGIYN